MNENTENNNGKKRAIINDLFDLNYYDLLEVEGFLTTRKKLLEQQMPRPMNNNKPGFLGIPK